MDYFKKKLKNMIKNTLDFKTSIFKDLKVYIIYKIVKKYMKKNNNLKNLESKFRNSFKAFLE